MDIEQLASALNGFVRLDVDNDELVNHPDNLFNRLGFTDAGLPIGPPDCENPYFLAEHPKNQIVWMIRHYMENKIKLIGYDEQEKREDVDNQTQEFARAIMSRLKRGLSEETPSGLELDTGHRDNQDGPHTRFLFAYEIEGYIGKFKIRKLLIGGQETYRCYSVG